jgi:16S rRNA G527 N7-methylase RsmG
LNLLPAAVSKFDTLVELLAKWNRVYNLTARRNEDTWVSHH